MAKIDISKKRLQYKKLIKESYLFTSCVIISSALMLFSFFSIYGVDLKIAIIYFTFQIVDMLLTPYFTILKYYTQLEYSPLINTIINLLVKIIRICLAIFILSPYWTEIGQLAESILMLLTYTIIRICKYRIKENTLVINSKNDNSNDNSISVK